MAFKTRKQLKQRIAQLEKEVAHHKKRTALVETADLPKCESVACYNCKYCIWLYHPGNGASYLLGCGKEIACKDFQATDSNKPPLEVREDVMEFFSEIGLLSSQGGQVDDLNSLVLVSPLPPCHQE